MNLYLKWCIYLIALDGVVHTLHAAGVGNTTPSATQWAISGVVNFVWVGLGVYLVARGIE